MHVNEVAMGILSKLFGKGEDKAPEVHEDAYAYTYILDKSPLIDNVYLSGVRHYCTRKDVGFFTGTVFNEKSNQYNKKAMAVYNNQKGRVVGHVPEAILEDYRKWCKDNCVCVGYVFFDGEHLLGRIRAYHPTLEKEIMMKDITEYARVVCEHFGWPVPTFTAE